MDLLNCNIIIDGYWRELNLQFIPNYSGIFFVYNAQYNTQDDVIMPKELLFIGQAQKIRDDILELTKKIAPWKKLAKEGLEFCFSSAYLSGPETERILSAFVYYFKPPGNSQYKDFFTYDLTTLSVTGKIALLEAQFVVEQKK